MAGRLQNEDLKTLAELTGAGGTVDQLPNDTKIYLTGLLKQLSTALSDGDIPSIQKQWKGSLYTNAQSGADVNLALGDALVVQYNGSSVTSIASLDSTTANKIIFLINTGSDATLKNQSVAGVVGKKIYTGTGADYTHKQNSVVALIYNATITSWSAIGLTSAGGGGAYTSQRLTATDLTTVHSPSTFNDTIIRITPTANLTQSASILNNGTVDGQKVYIFNDAANFILEFSSFTNMRLPNKMELQQYTCLKFVWDNTLSMWEFTGRT